MKSSLIFIFTVLALVFNSCHSSQSTQTQNNSTMEKDNINNLNGEWKINFLTESGDVSAIGSTFTFDIKENRYYSKAFCNSHFGEIKTITDKKVTFDKSASTMMMCEDDKMVLDKNFATAIIKTESYEFTNSSNVSLKDANGNVMMKLSK